MSKDEERARCIVPLQLQDAGLNPAQRGKSADLKIGCSDPGHELQLGLLRIGLATLDRRQAVQAQMRPLMIVVPQKFLQVPHAGLGRARPMDREALLIQGAKEPFDLSVRLRVMRSRPPECNAQASAGLLEACLSTRMPMPKASAIRTGPQPRFRSCKIWVRFGYRAPIAPASGGAAASGTPAPLPVLGSAPTNESAPDGQYPFPDSTPKAIFPAGAFSSTAHAPQGYKPLHACVASWRLILQGVTYVLGHHNRPLQDATKGS